jgi:ATP-dependent Clp protease ATP-binding subunit ClpB
MNANFKKYTEKSREAIVEAQNLSQKRRHSQVESWHLLHALVNQEHGIVPAVLNKMNQGANAVAVALDRELEKLPSVSGSMNASGVYMAAYMRSYVMSLQARNTCFWPLLKWLNQQILRSF